MSPYVFAKSDGPTLGVELELNLVDARTMALRSGATPILEALPPDLKGAVKPELFQCYVEINTGVCRDVEEVGRDLSAKLAVLERLAADRGMRLFWSGTHPFSPWHAQEVTQTERYLGLVDLLQETARRLITFGLHVHVGLDSGDKAIMICDRILPYLPVLLALSANSPFWQGRETGLHSHRSKVMETLPTSGLPPLMRNWSEYTWLLNHMVETGFIQTIREIWWDVRPHHNFGTVEVRICDMPPTLRQVLGLTGLVQCLVQDLSDEVDRGIYQSDAHPFLVRQNKWRAARYGMDAHLVDPRSFRVVPVRRTVREMVDRLEGRARDLGCRSQLEIVREMVEEPTGSVRQLATYRETGDLTEVVRRMIRSSAISEAP
ncbi:Carboxylate-amine ligase YbdK [Aquisphaera giovannonii]|uniref:Putative glutamate--cysteine ligase 2 n=1 Tax=Aquisphaera giovannonii TaxID=406548 RepID=A0A5B9WAS5_9BACT|nr:glutamate--cysteine ligase [Aquisphaera giovannonii]QEH37354.1 Carboxylate-amine ligase YbdK [Aquisphaera giovannonii]